MYFRNLSDIIDAFNKTSDFKNLVIDLQKCKIINEIDWLYRNYDDIDAISAYWLNLADFNNTAANLSYRQQFRTYSVEKIHNLVELRANFLYSQLTNLDNCKIDNKPLKVIVEELKALGQ